MSLRLSDSVTSAIERFMERRNLKPRAVEFLGTICTTNNLKRGDLSQSQNPTYATILKNLIKAINEEWTDLSSVMKLLEESEIAGRQHVCIYDLPKSAARTVIDTLRDIKSQSSDSVSFEDFVEMPSDSVVRILQTSVNSVLLKVVATRSYWRSEIDPQYSSDDEEWIHRWRVKERAAIVVKADSKSGTVQIRVPPREHGQETARSIYEFFLQALSPHFDVKRWLSKLALINITDSFNKILDNRNDFCLRYDTPESDTAKTRVSRLGAVQELNDLRNDPMWDFSNGYSRLSLRGSWIIDQRPIYVHMNLDKFRTGLGPKATTLTFARIFFPYLSTDVELDHVIRRIREHF